MREDMGKVLVEEPRHGRATARATQGSRRQRRERLDRDGEGGPSRLGISRDVVSRKHFGEHLGPLYRYLRQQVNRPWSKVYGELCAGLDRRNVVQSHLFEHIEDRVAVRTRWVDGEVVVDHRWRGPVPLADVRAEMYVHPVTGLLLRNRAKDAAARRRNEERAARRRALETERRLVAPGRPPHCQWHRLDGLWYELELRLLPAQGRVYDLVLRRPVGDEHRRLLFDRYGRGDCYAIAKRQLDGRTLARHRLA